MKIAVVALGGNAILPPGERGTIKQQLAHVNKTASQLKCLFGKYRVVITHGNGPQVGNLLLQQKNLKIKKPLDVLGAMTQGQLGYLIQNALKNIGKKAVTVVTQVVVSKERIKPTKPIGPYFRTKKERWMIKEPEGWRKIVPSPKPKEIIELEQIKELIKKGYIVIGCGGGGIPVARSRKKLQGIEAVIDKDRTSSLLARKLKAELLVILTDVDYVYLDYENKNKTPIKQITVKEIKKYMSHFKEGSMKPKIEAAIEFLKDRKGKVIITKPELLDKALRGETGTTIK